MVDYDLNQQAFYCGLGVGAGLYAWLLMWRVFWLGLRKLMQLPKASPVFRSFSEPE